MTLDEYHDQSVVALDALKLARERLARLAHDGEPTTSAQVDLKIAEGAVDRVVGEAVTAVLLMERAGRDVGDARARLEALALPAHLRAELIGIDPETSRHFREAHVEEWPTPRPLRESDADLPAWPIEVLPRWMADHIVATADQIQTPVDLCAQFALGALAAAAMGHARVQLGRWSEPLNLWLATALPSGGGKSPAEKAMTRPLRQWEAERHEASLAEVRDAEVRRRIAEKAAKAAETAASNGASVAEALEAASALHAIEVPAPFRLLADDATPEALVQILARHNGRIAVLSTEAGLLDVVAGTYAQAGRMPNIDVYLKGYSGDSIMVDRKGSGGVGTELRIDEPLLTVGLAMQPTVIDFVGRTNGQLEGRGFLARFLYAWPPSMVGHRDRSRVLTAVDDGGAGDRYGAALVACAERWADKAGHVLAFTPGAATRLVSAHQEHESQMVDGGRLRPVAEWMAKLQSATLRVAGLLHLADGRSADERIDVGTVERSLACADYWTSHALSMAATVDTRSADDAEAILEVIDRKGLALFRPRELWLTMRARFRTIEEMAPALQHLEACGYLRLAEGEWAHLGVRGSSVVVAVRKHDGTTLRAIEAAARHSERKNARNARNGLEVVFTSPPLPVVHHAPDAVPRVPRVLPSNGSQGHDSDHDAAPVDNCALVGELVSTPEFRHDPEDYL